MIFERIHSEENLRAAFSKVRAKNAGPGIDRVTSEEMEKDLDRHIMTLRQELASGAYQPMPVMIFTKRKAGGKQRSIGISTIRDRLVQAAVVQVIAPTFQQFFLPCTYAYMHGRSALQAVNKVAQLLRDGRLWVLKMDVADFFDSIDHDIMLDLLGRAIDEKPLLRLVSRLLKARIFKEMGLFDNLTGAVQGSGLSPLLSNIYMHPLDKELWGRYKDGYLRYSDDLVLCARDRQELEEAVPVINQCLSGLKLRPHPGKTSITHAADGFVYLGYHMNTGGKGPSEKSVLRLTEKLGKYDKIQRHEDAAGKVDEALTEIRGWYNYYQTLEPVGPGNIATLLAMTRLAMDVGDHRLAMKLAGKSDAFRNTHPTMAFLLAELCRGLGMKNHAMREYAKALDLDPGMEAATEGIRKLQAEDDDIFRRIKRTQLVLHHHPHYREGYLDLVAGYESLGLYGFAEKAYEKALEIDDEQIPPPRTAGENADSGSQRSDAELDYREIDQERFLELFSGRNSIHAKQWIDERGKWGFAPVERALKKKDIHKHLAGDVTLGVYPVTAEDTVGFIVFDVDTAKREILLKGPEFLEEARRRTHEDILRLKTACDALEMELYLEDSGYKGRHGWLFFSEKIPATIALKLGERIMREAGTPPEGLIRELFPMGKSDRHNSVIKLPLGINRKNNRRCLFLDDAGNPFPDQNEVIAGARKVSPDAVKLAIRDGSEEALRTEQAAQGDPSPGLKKMVEACGVVKFLINKAGDTNYLGHYERLVLLYTLTFAGREGVDLLHKTISRCINYNYHYTQMQIDRRKAYPISCMKILEYFPELIDKTLCSCTFQPPHGGYPSPVLYLLEAEMQPSQPVAIFPFNAPAGADKQKTGPAEKDSAKETDEENSILDFDNIFSREEAGLGDNGVEAESTPMSAAGSSPEAATADKTSQEERPSYRGTPRREAVDELAPSVETATGAPAVNDAILEALLEYLAFKQKKHDIEAGLARSMSRIGIFFEEAGTDRLSTKFGQVRRTTGKDGAPALIIETD